MKKKDGKKRLDETVKMLKLCFSSSSTASKLTGVDSGFILAFDMLEACYTRGKTKADVRRMYAEATEDERRIAAGVVQLLHSITCQLEPMLQQESLKQGDDFVQVEMQDAGDESMPDMPDEMPPELKAAVDKMVASGLKIKNVVKGKDGMGLIELHGTSPGQMDIAEKILQAIGAKPDEPKLPKGLEAEIEASITKDPHTSEISAALDTLGKKRPRLSKKDIPLS